MTVNFKDPLKSQVVNDAYVSKQADDIKTGKLGLNKVGEGAEVQSVQKAMAELFDVQGNSEGSAVSKNYSSTNYISNGQDRKQAIESLDEGIGQVSGEVEAIQSSIGQPNGIAELDENGQLPRKQLPSSAFEYISNFDPVAGLPALVDATTASFDAPVAGVTGNVQINANYYGPQGNILIQGDGVNDLTTLVQTWNNANPLNTISLISANGADIPDDQEDIQLTGGSNGEATATFDGPILGVTGNVQLTASIHGTDGNVTITGDGLSDLQTLVDNFNSTQPPTLIVLVSANGTDVPDAGEVMTLTGGIDENSSGDTYHVSADGSYDFGSGSITFNAGDKAVFSGILGKFEKWDTIDQVTEVNGYKGIVNLKTADVDESVGGPYYVSKDTKANLEALPRIEGKFYYATDEEKAYLSTSTDLIPIGSGGYIDAIQAVATQTDGLKFKFPDTIGAQPVSFPDTELSGLMYVSTVFGGFVPPFPIDSAPFHDPVTVSIDIANYEDLGTGNPYVTFWIANGGFSILINELTSGAGANKQEITGNGTYSVTWPADTLQTWFTAAGANSVGAFIVAFHTDGNSYTTNDGITAASNKWTIDNWTVEQSSQFYLNEDLGPKPSYVIASDFGIGGWPVQESVSNGVTVTADDNGILFDIETSTGDVNVTLPEISTLTLPFSIAIKKTETAVNQNIVTINASGSDTFNFTASISEQISQIGGAFHVMADDSGNWVLLPYSIDDTPKITMQIDDGGEPQVDETNRYYVKTIGNILDRPTNPENEAGSVYHTLDDDRTFICMNQPWFLSSPANLAQIFTEAYPPYSNQILQLNGKNFTYYAADETALETAKTNSNIGIYGIGITGISTALKKDNKVYCTNVTTDSTYWTLLNVDEQSLTINLLASTTAVIPDWTFAHADHKGMAIDYSLETSNNDVAVGTLRIATNGTLVNITNEASEVGATGVTFTAAVNGANIEISYVNSTANTAKIESDFKRY